MHVWRFTAWNGLVLRRPRLSSTTISPGDELHVGETEERVRAAHLDERVCHPILDGALRADRDEMDDHLRVAARLEDAPPGLELFVDLVGIRQISVVGDRDAAARVV